MQGKNFLIALILYAVLMAINLAPEVTKAQAEVAGEFPYGIPVRYFFIGVHALIFLPIFWWVPHFQNLFDYASHKKEYKFVPKLIKLFLVVDYQSPKHIRVSRNITAMGFLYFIALIIIWAGLHQPHRKANNKIDALDFMNNHGLIKTYGQQDE